MGQSNFFQFSILKEIYIRNVIRSIFAAAAVLFLLAGPVHADENTDKVVSKMADGDVAAICKGGRAAISEASSEATTELATEGELDGDYQAIGQAAGKQFFKEKCK